MGPLSYEDGLFRALLSEDAILAMDLDWRVLIWNEAAERLHGWTAAEAVGRYARDVAPLDLSYDERLRIRQETEDRGLWRGEVASFGKDGTPAEIELTTVEVRNARGQLIGFAEIRRDLSDRVRAHTALLDARRQAESILLDHVEDAVIVTDRDFRVTIWNSGAERLYGLAAQEVIGRPAREVAGYPRNEARRTLERELLENGQARTELAYGKDGSAVEIELVAVAVKDERGEVGGYLWIHRDITERKHMHQRLDEARELERSRIARDLHDDVLQSLAEALAVAMVSRSPAPGRAGQLVPLLERVAEQLRNAIYDLRLNSDELKPFPDLLRELVEVHRELEVVSEIDLELGDGVPTGSLGHTGSEILRIIGEALVNARQHAGSRHIRVGASGTQAGVRLEVSDDGRGFDPTSPTSPLHQGITSMYERAHLLGANLEVRSELGVGTTVRLEATIAP